MKLLLQLIAVATVLGIGSTLAQDMAMGAASLPPACTAGVDHAAVPPMPDMGSMMAGMNEAHQAMMATMGPMHTSMATGMMAPDPDVAFLCGMIGHHQGAIDMAKAELAYGDDDWARQQAQAIIDAQTKEIADITKRLEELAAE
jgi:uncharacterized protein (DUF305 family)